MAGLTDLALSRRWNEQSEFSGLLLRRVGQWIGNA
jgi:hypothetical protein